MPKFLAVNVIVRTYETFAHTEEEGHENIRKYCEGDGEDVEGGVRAFSHKLGWCEFKLSDVAIIAGRDKALASFLELMGKLPNTPKPPPPLTLEAEVPLIVKPYDPFPDTRPVLPCSKIEKIVQDITKDIPDEPRK